MNHLLYWLGILLGWTMTLVYVYKCVLVLHQPLPTKKRERHMDVWNNCLICMQNEPLMLLLLWITGLSSTLQNFI